MSRLRKITILDLLRFGEACFFLLTASLLKKFVPLRRYAPLLGKHGASQACESAGGDPKRLLPVIRAVQRAIRYSPVRSECMEQAICGCLMLRMHKLPSDFFLGVDKNEGEAVIAHAWLKSGGRFVTGRTGHKQFTVISVFSNRPPPRKAA